MNHMDKLLSPAGNGSSGQWVRAGGYIAGPRAKGARSHPVCPLPPSGRLFLEPLVGCGKGMAMTMMGRGGSPQGWAGAKGAEEQDLAALPLLLGLQHAPTSRSIDFLIKGK